jgi:hypothetical protein
VGQGNGAAPIPVGHTRQFPGSGKPAGERRAARAPDALSRPGDGRGRAYRVAEGVRVAGPARLGNRGAPAGAVGDQRSHQGAAAGFGGLSRCRGTGAGHRGCRRARATAPRSPLPSGWPRRTPAMPGGSAISPSRRKRSATFFVHRAACRRRWRATAPRSPSESGWPRRTPAMPGGSAISPSRRKRSATFFVHRAACRRRWRAAAFHRWALGGAMRCRTCALRVSRRWSGGRVQADACMGPVPPASALGARRLHGMTFVVGVIPEFAQANIRDPGLRTARVLRAPGSRLSASLRPG